MVKDPNNILVSFISRLNAIELRYENLEDRVSVMEEHSIDHENRLEELETWQVKVDDKLEDY